MSALISILNHKPNSVVKMISDKELLVKIRVKNPEFRYRLWSNWASASFHSITLEKIDDTHYQILLLCRNTGFYTLNFQYQEKDKWLDSGSFLEVHVDPDWIYDAIVYNVFLRAFSKEDKEEIQPGEGGTFEDVINHIDEFVALGINVLYLNPFHLIGELYRKYNPNNHVPYFLQPGSPYSIRDYKSIDPEVAFPQKDSSRFITDPKKQFKKLVDAAHKRGMRVIMDLVFNHTAHDFILQRIYPEWFLYKEKPTSADAPYLYPKDIHNGKPWGDARYSVPPYDHGSFGWTDTAKLNWEYNSPPAPNLPPPNLKLTEMYEYFISVPKYWVKEFGIDGFRTDITYSVPTAFWKRCIRETRKAAKEYYPHNGSIDGEVIFIGESWEDKLSELFEAGFSFIYGSYAYKIFNPLSLKGFLDWIYNLTSSDFPENARWFIFPECHDFDRASSKFVPRHLVDDLDLKIPEKEEVAVRGNVSRWVLTACLPGMPMVFMGFEKVEWQPVDHISYSKIDWQNTKDIHEVIAVVNRVRHNHLALQKGSYQFVETSQGLDDATQIFAFSRFTQDQVIFPVINMDIMNKATATIDLPKIANFDPSKPFILKDLLTGKLYHRKKSQIFVKLELGQSHIFLVEQNWGD